MVFRSPAFQAAIRRFNLNSSFLFHFLAQLTIPLVSLLLGNFLFSVPQTIDLLRDYESDYRVLFFECLRYLIIAIIIWAVPLYVSGRFFTYRSRNAQMVRDDYELPPLAASILARLARYAPLVMALSTFLVYARATLSVAGADRGHPSSGWSS